MSYGGERSVVSRRAEVMGVVELCGNTRVDSVIGGYETVHFVS